MTDCVDRILDFYQDKELYKSINSQIWISQYILNLMKYLNQNYGEERSRRLVIKNCLLLLINLCFNVKFPDHYHSKGKDFKDLSNNERNELFGVLIDEIYLTEIDEAPLD